MDSSASKTAPEAILEQGAVALRNGDGGAARIAYQAAVSLAPTGAALEGLGSAAYIELDFACCIESWERAYAAYQAERHPVGPIRTARKIGYLYGMVVGDAAVMSGWLARAQTLLDRSDESVERGWVSLTGGMFESDRATREMRFREALKIGHKYSDADLEFATLAYLGASLVHDDRTEEGMLLLDEALAAVAGKDVDDFMILEEIFCQLFSACEHAQDVIRADQWIRIGDDLAERRNLPAVSAFCRTHYGGILTAAGRWDEADAALSEAVRIWGLGFSSLRGGALIRLAELRVRQGRFEEAEQLLEGLDVDAEAARPLAALLLVRGDVVRAGDVLERALREVDPSSSTAGPLLALLVEVRLAQGDIDDATAAADLLETCATSHSGHYLRATAALARGRVCLAAGTGDPSDCLREALSGFAKAQLPMELARSASSWPMR